MGREMPARPNVFTAPSGRGRHLVRKWRQRRVARAEGLLLYPIVVDVDLESGRQPVDWNTV
jgi:hypothetical protein